MESEIDFAPLLLVLGLAFFIPLLTHRLSGGAIPSVVGELAAGIIFGRTLLGVIEANVWLEFLSLFGFAYLMFLAGLEVDMRLLVRPLGRRRRHPRAALRHPLVAGAGLLALILVATALTLWGLNRWGQVSDFELLLFVLSASAVGVMAPVLKHRQESGAYAQVLLVTGFLLEFVAIVAIGIIAAIDREGLGVEAALILALPAMFVALLWLATQGRRRFPEIRALFEELAHASSQIQIRGALALLVVFVVLSQVVGTELVLGAFFAGLALAILTPRQGSSMRVKLDALGYGFFIPIFFITAGAEMDLEALGAGGSGIVLIPALIAAGLVVKLLPAIVMLWGGFGLRRAVAGGLLLSANLSIVLAATTIAVDSGRLGAAETAALLVLALVSTAAAPLAFNAVLPVRKAEKVSRAIVVGAGRTGRELAPRLYRAGLAVTVIDVDEEALKPLAQVGCETLVGDARDPDVIAAARPELAQVAVVSTEDATLTYEAAARLREQSTDLRIVTWVGKTDPRLEALGVEAYGLGAATAMALEGAVLRPGLYQALGTGLYGGLEEVVLRNTTLAERPLSALHLPGNVRVILIMRDGNLIIPEGESELQLHDYVTLGGEPSAVREAFRLFSGRALLPEHAAPRAAPPRGPAPIDRELPGATQATAAERLEREAGAGDADEG